MGLLSTFIIGAAAGAGGMWAWLRRGQKKQTVIRTSPAAAPAAQSGQASSEGQ